MRRPGYHAINLLRLAGKAEGTAVLQAPERRDPNPAVCVRNLALLIGGGRLMTTTYDVRIWKTEVYEGKRGTTYYVRWKVAGKPWREPFKGKALADGFRSDLVAAARKGEAFDIESGRPVSMQRAARDMPWYEFACKFVDMKWPRVAATTRRTHAEALTRVTTALFTNDHGKPDDQLIRTALCRWAFNTNRRDHKLRPVLDGLTMRLDGTPAAPSVVSRKRKILNTAAEYAVELKLLTANPIPALKWTAPRTTHEVDRRSVCNPVQARTLIEAVRSQRRSGPRLVAFFGCLYFAALRPEEAVSLA